MSRPISEPIRTTSQTTASEQQTEDLGKRLGQAIVEQTQESQRQSGYLVGLTGTLGAGKTRLTQGIAVGLGVDTAQVTSPTFTLCVPYQGQLPMLHLDAYRIGSLEEVDELGLDEQLAQGVILIVEWVERIQSVLPPLDIHVEVQQLETSTRQFKIHAFSDQAAKLLDGLGKSSTT